MLTAADEIKVIQIGRRALRLDDVTYRAMLGNLCGGKTSSTALTAPERQCVIDHLKARGFVIRPKGADPVGPRNAPMVRKLKAMWWTLAGAGEVGTPDDPAACFAAVEAWARQPGRGSGCVPQALRFASPAQLAKLIEEMKAWCARVGVGAAT